MCVRYYDEYQLPSVDEWRVIPDEDMDAQRGKATCPRAHSQKVTDPGFECTQVSAQSPCLELLHTPESTS